MKKSLTPRLTLLCVLFAVSVCHAQERLMFSRPGYNYDQPDQQNGLYYINKDGSGVPEHATNFLPMAIFGASSQYFFVSKDGELVGANSVEGEPDGYGNGTLYRVTAKGVVITHHFNYPVNESMPLEESPVNDNLYTVGLGANGEYQPMTGTKYDGFTSGYYGNYGLKMNNDHLLVSKDGQVYSTAPIGGTYRQGYIYKWAGPKIEILYSFSKPTGYYPQGKLLEGADGYLYGVTRRGGGRDYGVIFKVKTDGTDYQVLHSFSKIDGTYPDRGFVQSKTNGNLYSMTSLGGLNNLGVIFRIMPDGTGFKKLHDIAFTRNTTHGFPQNLLLDSYGYLYGKFPAAAGTIFRIKIDGRGLQILYDENTTIYNIQFVRSITPAYRVVSPANRAANVSTSYVFQADSVPGALRYSLELSQRSDFATSSTIIHSATHKFLVRGLAPLTKYYARVRSSLWLKPGPVTSFTTAANTFYSAVTTPADGSSGSPAPTLTITVKAVTGASTYTVELSESPYFDGAIISGTTDNSHRTFRMHDINYNTLYYARVKTDVITGYGKITSFTTTPATTMASSIEPPSVELSVYPNPSTTGFTLKWSGNEGSDISFEISDFTGTVIHRFTIKDAAPEVKFGETLPRGMYMLKTSCDKCAIQRLVKE